MSPEEPTKRIFLSVAERSGDMHAANLVRAIDARDETVRFEGFGGELLRDAGCSIREDLVSVASMGVGFVRHILRFYRVVRSFQTSLSETRPDAVLLVDSPGLNFILARIATWRRIPVVYYICPQVWAWAPWRRSKVLRYTNLLLVILSFEEELYRNPRVPVRYVGHPLADDLARVPRGAGADLRRRLGLEPGLPVLGLLPGSRDHEVNDLMPLYRRILDAMGSAGTRCRVLVSCFRETQRAAIENALRGCGFRHEVVPGDSRPLMLASDALIVASGTASLEAAYFQKPMVVLYRARAAGRFLFRLFSVTPFFTLPNIVGARLTGGRPLVEERLCSGDEADELAPAVRALLEPGPPRDSALDRLRLLGEQVFRPGASATAADSLLEFLAAHPARR